MHGVISLPDVISYEKIVRGLSRLRCLFCPGSFDGVQSAVQLLYIIMLNSKSESGTWIKGQIWPPLEPKTESCFSPISPNSFIRGMVKV